jgi:hypothetical protein
MQSSRSYLLESHNPLRALDWRSNRASGLLQRGARIYKKIDDEDTAALVACLKSEQLQSETAKRRHQRKWEPLLAAREIHGQDGPDRWQMKARLLTGQDDEAIGRCCDLDPQTVHWYEALFFNVRDRLEARDWIALGPLKAAVLHGLKPGDHETLWMLFGYYGGPTILGPLMNVSLLLPQLNEAAFSLLSPLEQDIAKAIQSFTMPIPLSRAMEILQLKDLPKKAPASPASSGSVLDAGIWSASMTDLLKDGTSASAVEKPVSPPHVG